VLDVGFVPSAAFSPDGSRIVTASRDKTARIWDAASAKEIAMRRHHSLQNSAALRRHDPGIGTEPHVNRSEERRAAISPDKSRTTSTAREIAVLRGHGNSLWSAAFSPDGSRIVTASWDKTARIWDAASGKEIAMRGHDNLVNSAAFSRDGSRIVTASEDNTARIWDAATAKEIAVLR